jgi:predicted amidophosphoribosyltransferase
MAKLSPKCGKPVADESTKFCSNCGLKLPDSSVKENDPPIWFNTVNITTSGTAGTS